MENVYLYLDISQNVLGDNGFWCKVVPVYQ